MEKATGKIWNKIVENRDQDIDNLIEMLKYLNKKGVDVFINVNNNYEGSSPLTIKKIQDKLNEID